MVGLGPTHTGATGDELPMPRVPRARRLPRAKSRSGIENFFQYRAANGMAEGFNNVVGTIKKQAYGFHDPDYLRLKILRMCGKLE